MKLATYYLASASTAREIGLVDKAGVTMRNLTEAIDASLTDARVLSMDVALTKSDLTVI
jgi:hypothetical protein